MRWDRGKCRVCLATCPKTENSFSRENLRQPLFILEINVGGTLAGDFLGREERVVGLQCTSCIGDGGRDLTVTWFWRGTASGRRAVSERNTRSIRTRCENVLESSSFLIIGETLRNDSFF